MNRHTLKKRFQNSSFHKPTLILCTKHILLKSESCNVIDWLQSTNDIMSEVFISDISFLTETFRIVLFIKADTENQH